MRARALVTGVALQPVTEGSDGNPRRFIKASSAEPDMSPDVTLEEVNFASEDHLAIFVEDTSVGNGTTACVL